jgi:hypothetical protein
MAKKCPSCGNKEGFTSTLVNEEYTCNECGSEFNESTNEAYTSANYRMFCERLVKRVRSNINDPIIASAIGEISRGYINEGKDYSKEFIGKLSEIATELYIDYTYGKREQYDFAAIMEGIESLIELHNIQNPNDDEFSIQEDDVDQDDSQEDQNVGPDAEIERPSEALGDNNNNLDPLSMLDADADPAEKTEHLALAAFKTNVEGLKNTLGLLDSAEKQELENGSDEGQDHEENEAKALADIKNSVGQLQASLNDYLNNEANSHYNAPSIRNKIDDVSSKLNGETIEEGIESIKAQLLEICSEACAMLEDCGYPVTEDAQLVSQDHIDDQLQQAIDTNTKEFPNTIDEAVIGGQNVDPGLLPPDVHGEVPTSLDINQELDQYPGEIEDIPLDTDEQFKRGQSVVFESEFWTIQSISNGSVILESENGESIETDIENIELSNKEGFDVMEEHYGRGTNNLSKIWSEIEESINKAPVYGKPHRSCDLKEYELKYEAASKNPFKGKGAAGAVKVGGEGLKGLNKNTFDPEKTIGGMDFDSQEVGKDAIDSIGVVKKKSPNGKVFDVVRILSSGKDGKSKVIYDTVGLNDSYFLRKMTRDQENKDTLEPIDLVKGGTLEDVTNALNNLTSISPEQIEDVTSKLGALVGVKEALLPNSNIQIQNKEI